MCNNLLNNSQWSILSLPFDASQNVTHIDVLRLLKYSIIFPMYTLRTQQRNEISPSKYEDKKNCKQVKRQLLTRLYS